LEVALGKLPLRKYLTPSVYTLGVFIHWFTLRIISLFSFPSTQVIRRSSRSMTAEVWTWRRSRPVNPGRVLMYVRTWTVVNW